MQNQAVPQSLLRDWPTAPRVLRLSRTGRGARRSSYITSKKGICETVKKIVESLENPSSKTSTDEIVKTLSRIPTSFRKLVVECVDDHNLDILHHSIINNNPTLVEYLICEPTLFPSTHMPHINPYAHLAAISGHAQCLCLILQHRPLDFFESSKPSHAIVLPDYIKSRLNLHDLQKKHFHRISDKMKKLKMTAEAAEMAIKAMDAEGVDEAMFLKRFGFMDGAEETARVTRKRIQGRLGKVTQSLVKLLSFGKEKAQRTALILPSYNMGGGYDKTGETINDILEDKSNSHFRRHVKPHSGEHQITIYRDVFPDIGPGVTRGVGQPVTVNMSNTISLPKTISSHREERDSFYLWNRKFTLPPLKTEVTPFKTHKPQPSTEQLAAPTNRQDTIANRRARASSHMIEVGVRGNKKYKDFHLKSEKREPPAGDDYMNKTPLDLAAEHGHVACAQVILEMVTLKNNPLITTKEPLTLATKARSPEAIMLLKDKNISPRDYQGAVLVALQEMLPDCLSALLPAEVHHRSTLFGDVNLFHILYTQSLEANYRFQLMPQMTSVLIKCNENVNARNVPRTFPMYTLINCAFNVTIGRQMVYFVECLKMLLEAKANPHFNEDTLEHRAHRSNRDFTRKPFYSAVSCILESARNSVNYFENTYWSKALLKKLIHTIERYDRTKRRILNDVLLDYMDTVCELGIDTTVLKTLLRYGGNPDFREDGKYAVNLYFDRLFPYLARFDISDDYSRFNAELDDLIILCHAMTPGCLVQAQRIFLRNHLLEAPIQALSITRYFAYLINDMVRTPQPLKQLTARRIWLQVKRNAKLANQLPLPSEIMALVIP